MYTCIENCFIVASNIVLLPEKYAETALWNNNNCFCITFTWNIKKSLNYCLLFFGIQSIFPHILLQNLELPLVQARLNYLITLSPPARGLGAQDRSNQWHELGLAPRRSQVQPTPLQQLRAFLNLGVYVHIMHPEEIRTQLNSNFNKIRKKEIFFGHNISYASNYTY